MKESNVRIVSGGHATSTKVYVDEVEVKGVTELKIDPIGVDDRVSLRMTVLTAELDMIAGELLLDSKNAVVGLSLKVSRNEQGIYYVGAPRDGALEWREVGEQDLYYYGLTPAEVKSIEPGKTYSIKAKECSLESVVRSDS